MVSKEGKRIDRRWPIRSIQHRQCSVELFFAKVYYLLLLGVALRIPAKLQNGYDDSHGQPAQQDNKNAACCRFTNGEDGQTMRKGNQPETNQKRERE